MPLRDRRERPHRPDGRRGQARLACGPLLVARGKRTSTPRRSASRSRTPATCTATRIFPSPRCGRWRRFAGISRCRHDIAPQHFLAHSDVAPGRKIDPGEKFDWPWLYGQGIGHWVVPAPFDEADTGVPPDVRADPTSSGRGRYSPLTDIKLILKDLSIADLRTVVAGVPASLPPGLHGRPPRPLDLRHPFAYPAPRKPQRWPVRVINPEN